VRDIRYCPGCGIGIEKDGGCGAMWCIVCDHSFHWDDAPRNQPPRPIYSLRDIQERQHAAAALKQTKRREWIWLLLAWVICVSVLAYTIYQDKFTHDGQVARLERNIQKSLKEADHVQQNIAWLLEKVRDYETQISALRGKGATS